jgi:hypothetical protein
VHSTNPDFADTDGDGPDDGQKFSTVPSPLIATIRSRTIEVVGG